MYLTDKLDHILGTWETESRLVRESLPRSGSGDVC